MKKIFTIFCLLAFLFGLQCVCIDRNAAYARQSKKEKQAQLEKERYMKEMRDSQPKEGFDYQKAFDELSDVQVQFIHEEDPDEYYDTQKMYFSPYPLIRLTQTLYVKKEVIQPGFYLLTPREHDGKWYMLFKQNGKVAHIIPVYQRDLVPETFYETHLSKPKLTPSQKVHMGFLSFLGKFDSSKRRDPVKSYMEINDLENYFVSIIIYYGPRKYSTIFRTIKL